MSQPLYKQGDIVWLKNPYPVPDGTLLHHPVLIISSDTANGYEKYYTGVMMTTSIHTDKYTFKCHSQYFEGYMKEEHCQIRLYIILSFREDDVKSKMNKLKPAILIEVLKQIRDYVFT